MMGCFVLTICFMLIGSVLVPLLSGEPITEARSEAVKNVTLVIIGGVMHWITEPAK